MLASFEEAEDAVQETLLRAWRSRDSFDGSSLFRAWLYRIATNVCLDMLRQSSRRPATMHSFAEVPWLQPYPDRLLDEVAPSDDQPDAVVVERETIELDTQAVHPAPDQRDARPGPGGRRSGVREPCARSLSLGSATRPGSRRAPQPPR